jgi:riboflavin kinase/FMN adenylyltransferase
MHVFHGLPSQPPPSPTLLTIGNFDGVHLGHRALIEEMVRTARGKRSWAGLLTFDPHPLAVLAPERPLAFLTSPEERLELLDAYGLDFVVIHRFTLATARMPAREFVSALRERLRLAELWVGPDFTLGHRQEGDIAALQTLGEELGFELHVVQPFCLEGQSVRSTRIRTLLQQGSVHEAAGLLGRSYHLRGQVVPGAGRGRVLGFPTVNLEMEPGRVLPGDGIYASWVEVGGKQYAAAINLGIRPTFEADEPQRTVEAYLLDFQGQIYGQTVELTFVERLRPESRFESADDLVEQIARDVIATRRVLGAARRGA